jgi:predicted ATP-grasp superfamily ATP-dependent carboligase
MSEQPLLIIGASARAAAFSALRAGFAPWCCDLFADADLKARCPAMVLRGRYPQGFTDVIAGEMPGPWMYTGGLENHPTLIFSLALRRPLWGNDAGVLALVRDPAFLAKSALRVGLYSPEFQWSRPRSSEGWIFKPVNSSGGIGVRLWDEAIAVGLGKGFVQRFIAGTPAAAVYVGCRGRAQLLGLTRQLVGESWLNVHGFRYCGSIGPLPIPTPLENRLQQLGDDLARRGNLVGLFGVDGIRTSESFAPIEINPRYTASMEVIEYATGETFLRRHALACQGNLAALQEAKRWTPSLFLAKGILYATQAGTWTRPLLTSEPIHQLPEIADVPEVGAHYHAGQPVVTLFGRGKSEEEAETKLRASASQALSGSEIWERGCNDPRSSLLRTNSELKDNK